jgi:hypothetical protein
MDPNIQLMFYVFPAVFGFLLVLPFSKAISEPLMEIFPSLQTERGRILVALNSLH